MSSNGLRKVKAAIERDDSAGLLDESMKDGQVCPACNRYFPKSSGLVVCKYDRTLLKRVRQFDSVITEPESRTFAHGQYKIRQFVGEGDLSRVYLAQDMKSWSEVVIKTIKPHLLGTARRIRRFADSLQETASLQHPGIVTVFDSGISKASEASAPTVYIVAEKLKASKNLKTILHHSGPLAPYVVIETMVKVCEILHYAASTGWLHKDIKPSNIFISIEGEQIAVKISDFGVAERMFRNLEWESNSTKTTSIYGNAAYLAPEVAFGVGGGAHTIASDVYSLGCTMYHVLKGMQPFEGNNDFDTLLRHAAQPPKPFADELRVPTKLEAIVMKCLSKDPADRYTDFAELGKDLDCVT